MESPFAGPEEVFSVSNSQTLNDNGQTVFTTVSVVATGPLSFEGVERFLLTGDEAGLRVLARSGQPDISPELPAGTRYGGFGVPGLLLEGAARINNNNRIVHGGIISGPGVDITNQEVVVDRDGDQATILYRKGEPAPGLPDGVVFGCPPCGASTALTEPRLNDLDQTILLARITGPGVTAPANSALYVYEEGVPSLIASTTVQDPTEDRIRELREAETNERGEVIYRGLFGSLAAPAETLFVGPADAPVPVIASGDDAPGLPGFSIATLIFAGTSDFVLPIDRPVLSGAGNILFAADLAGPGITPFSLNKRALFTGAPDDLQLVVRAGSDAPGVSGATFTSVGNFATNVRGDVVFLAIIEQSGRPLSSVWSWTADDGLQLIARDGGVLPGRGSSPQIETVFFRGGAGQQSGFGSKLSESGIAIFDANFIGGTAGVYTIQVGSADECQVDLDGDGELTLFDFLEFQNLFDAGSLDADFDADGRLTLFDFLEFQNLLDAGCS